MKPIWIISAAAGAIVVVATATVVLTKQTSTTKSTPENQTTAASSTGGTTNTNSQTTQTISGEYWCRSYNYNGAGGSCSLQRHLILNADGSYTFGSSSGRYSYAGSKITFDGDLASRGPATYTTDQQIRWEFTDNGAPYTITYYYRQAVQ